MPGWVLVIAGNCLIAWGFGHAFDLGVVDLRELWRIELKTSLGTIHQSPLDLPTILELDFDWRAWSKAIDLQFHLGGPLGVMFGGGREGRSSGSSREQEKYENPR